MDLAEAAETPETETPAAASAPATTATDLPSDPDESSNAGAASEEKPAAKKDEETPALRLANKKLREVERRERAMEEKLSGLTKLADERKAFEAQVEKHKDDLALAQQMRAFKADGDLLGALEALGFDAKDVAEIVRDPDAFKAKRKQAGDRSEVETLKQQLAEQRAAEVWNERLVETVSRTEHPDLVTWARENGERQLLKQARDLGQKWIAKGRTQFSFADLCDALNKGVKKLGTGAPASVTPAAAAGGKRPTGGASTTSRATTSSESTRDLSELSDAELDRLAKKTLQASFDAGN